MSDMHVSTIRALHRHGYIVNRWDDYTSIVSHHYTIGRVIAGVPHLVGSNGDYRPVSHAYFMRVLRQCEGCYCSECEMRRKNEVAD